MATQAIPAQETDKLPKIIFYDVQHTLPPPFTPHSSWSPFTTRIALALRYRNLPYTRVPTSYPSIGSLLASKNVPPALDASGKINKTPYTLPAMTLIYSDSEKGEMEKVTTIMDSTPISTTLESLTSPSATHPSLFPLGQKSHEQVKRIGAALNAPGLRKQIVPFIPAILDERGAEYFIRTRSEVFGKALEVVRAEAIEEAEGMGGLEVVFEKALRGVAGVYLEEEGQGEGEGEGGVFLGGRRGSLFGREQSAFVCGFCFRGRCAVVEVCEGG